MEGVSVRREADAPALGRRFYRTVLGYEDKVLSPFNSTIDTLTHAVVERAKLVKVAGGGFGSPPRPHAGVTYDSFLAAFEPSSLPSGPMTTAEFISSRPGRKKRVYKEAVCKVSGLHFATEAKRFSTTQFFIKVEKTEQQHTNYWTQETTKKPVPRLINPRHPLYNLELGKYTVQVEHQIYEDIGKMFGRPCIAKGMNYWERAATIKGHFDEFQDPVWVAGDASRFDQHTHTLSLKLEHKVLKRYYPGDRKLRHLLELQFGNRGFGFTSDGFLQAELGDMRMSGDMNTALGNCIISAALVWTRLHELGVRGYALVDGDDFGVVMERSDARRFMQGAGEWYLRYGYNIAWEEPVDVIEKVAFCQTHPIWTPDGYVMCRDPHKVLNSDLCGYSQCQSDKYYLALVAAIGEAGCSIAAGMPILQEFYRTAVRLGKRNDKVKLIEFEKYWYGQYLARLTSRARPVHWRTRVSFELAYGCPPHVQEQIEQSFQYITSLDLSRQGTDPHLPFETTIPLTYYY